MEQDTEIDTRKLSEPVKVKDTSLEPLLLVTMGWFEDEKVVEKWQTLEVHQSSYMFIIQE